MVLGNIVKKEKLSVKVGQTTVITLMSELRSCYSLRTACSALFVGLFNVETVASMCLLQ